MINHKVINKNSEYTSRRKILIYYIKVSAVYRGRIVSSLQQKITK